MMEALPESLLFSRMPPSLNNIPAASARVQPAELTPRTPHSRAGRAEEGFTEFELEQYGDSDYREHALQQQSEPLLVSSTSPTFPPSGYRARGDDDMDTRGTRRDPRSVIRWLVANLGLIFGSALALALLMGIILSYERPDVLLSVVGVSETSSSSPVPAIPEQDEAILSHPENIISYENYTRFPLDPLEYKAECHKLMGEVMGPMEFWSGEEDVVHHHQVDTRFCGKTITYMLDGHVGLFADLALMAQAAGLAREVNRT
jgi:hypothetical protein